ncbi:MAG: DUF4430 domain-containing protein [Planctomycetaceae bacterium]|nr:DUF4430 domain-containing protein [Planctomycetales bacterium]MCB9923115.1 DUF4430 domain-containing protein [Planctomycetaceae bacterium]
MRRRWLSVLVVAMFAVLLAANRSMIAAEAEVVRLVIDYHDGVEKHFNAIAWKSGMTVMDAMQAAKKHPRGISFEHKGKGATVLLTKIDDVENEGRGRNWLYRVNGDPGDRSIGIYELKPGDAVLWRFDNY